ncbi:FMN-dependent NADH-azoreductase [Photobacterium minamisatsumaniensis]|uniref:FMN-dependent NADH-azoreductase n=1 Tax=Photobacterium minamisatsumaniensis TaxID=2910233 RepID=UPI003D131D7B
MKKVLSINSSLRIDDSHSRQLVGKIISQIKGRGNGVVVTERDVATYPIPHFSADTALGFAGGESKEALAASVLSTQLIDEVKAHDILVIGAPVYNFAIPSTLKAWIDHIARAGVTFNYTAEGPKGYLTEKKVIIVIASGGGQVEAIEQQLSLTLSMIGLDDVTFVYATGLDMPDSTQNLTAIHREIEALATRIAA